MYALDLLCFATAFRFDLGLMRRLASDPAAVVTVAEFEAEMVGFAIANLRRGKTGLSGYLTTLDVDPAQQRGGLGRRLMEETERRCGEAGARRMNLHVWTENWAAVGFYEALGYVRRGRSARYYGEAGDAWRYGKRL